MERDGEPMRPAWLRPGALVLVFGGGVFGAGAREVLGMVLPPSGSIPWAVLLANLLGAFLLGWLLTALGRSTAPGADRARLLLGTGLLGGFTTYSALALVTAELFADGAPGLALGYGVGTVLLGALSTLAGVIVGRGAAARRADGVERGRA